MTEQVKLKDLFTRKQLFEKSGPIGQAEAVDLKMGNNVLFDYNKEEGLGLCRKGPNTKGVYVYGDHLPFDSGAVAELFKNIGTPLNFALDTPIELTLPILNYYYRDKFEGLPVRFLTHNNRVVAMALHPRDEFISLGDLIHEVESAIGTDQIAGYHKPMFNWGGTTINVVLNETFEVVTKDPLNLGIRFEHPLNEARSTQVNAYTFRQWCSNGAITVDNIKGWSRKEGARESFKKWIPSVMIEARKALAEEKIRLTRLTEIKTDSDTSQILDRVLEDSGIRRAVREEIRSIAIDQPPRTLYDLWNILTRVATHSKIFEKHPGMLSTLEYAAGELAFNSKLCPVCHHKVD